MWDELLFLVDSGRAVVFPVYQGSFDRRGSSELSIHHFLELVRAMSLVIAAMAHQELGKTQQARASLDEAVALIDENLPKRDNGILNPHFTMRGQKLRHDWIFAELLRREAEARRTDFSPLLGPR